MRWVGTSRLTTCRKVSARECAQIVANRDSELGYAFAVAGYALPARCSASVCVTGSSRADTILFAAGCDVGSTGSFWMAFGASKAPAFRTVVCGERVGSTWGPPWTVFASSGAPTFRTIALDEIGGMPDCVVGELAREKITAALAVAPTAHATNVTKRVRRVLPRVSAHSG